MYNMSFSGQSNPPWQKSVIGNIPNISNHMAPQNSGIPYHNSQMYSQSGMDQQAGCNQNMPFIGNMFNQAAPYPPTRGNVNPMGFQNSGNNRSGGVHTNQTMSAIGTVTKLNNDYGFINDEVFFNTSICQGKLPKISDSVGYDAYFNPNAQFKWTATRVQCVSNIPNLTVIPLKPERQIPTLMSGQNLKESVHPPMPNSNENQNQRTISNRKNSPQRWRSPDRYGSRERKEHLNQRNQENSSERSKRREDADRKDYEKRVIRDRHNPSVEKRDRERSPVRRSSPKKRRVYGIPRYVVQIPKTLLTIPSADVQELRRRYSNMYIPSDFCYSEIKWIKSFTPNQPFSIHRPCSFHIMNKLVDPPESSPNVIEPEDADYTFSARVMLMECPPISEIYRKCLHQEEGYEDFDYIHPSRLINFLVGTRGHNESMAIGGAWSSSMDGENPESDPSVLIKTAIRTCRNLTGIDLSNCTQWYRFLELYYHRAEHTHNGRILPSRVETVVIFLPDINSCLPTPEKWKESQQMYKAAMERFLNHQTSTPNIYTSNNTKADFANSLQSSTNFSSGLGEKMAELPTEDTTGLEKKVGNMDYLNSNSNLEITEESLDNSSKENSESVKFSEMDIVVIDDEQTVDHVEVDMTDILILDEYCESKTQDSISSKKDEKKVFNEKERQQIERRFKLPENPHIIVHPSKTAKSGKFNCSVLSLSVLLDYTLNETKERSFEVSLFAELFNEMLMRDFGFNIFKELWLRNEKAKRAKTTVINENKSDDDAAAAAATKPNTEMELSVSVIPEQTRSVKQPDVEIKNNKRSRKNSRRDDETDDDNYSTRSGEKRSSKVEKRMLINNPELLLSFVYFDTTHCGYIFQKDLEELFLIIGINLSRRQIRTILSNFISRDSLYYRQLTDKVVNDLKESGEDKVNNEDSINQLEKGDQSLLLEFIEFNNQTIKNKNKTNSSTESNGIIYYNDALVDVGKLLDHIRRMEKAHADIESKFNEMCKSHSELESNNTKANNKIKELQTEVKRLNRKLTDADADVFSLTRKYNDQHSILSNIYEKVYPLFGRQEKSHKSEILRDKEKEKDRKDDKEKGKDVDIDKDKVKED